MADAKCVIYVKNARNARFNAYAIQHMSFFRYDNMGVKRCVIILEMQTIAIKELVNKANGLQFENISLQNFPLYNCCGLGYVPIRFHEKCL